MKTRYIFTSIILIFFSLNTFAQFSISAEIRPRTEYRDGFKTPSQAGDQAAFFTEQRSRLNFNFVDSSYSVRLSLQDVRIWGENSQIFKEEDGNTFLSEAWVDYKISNHFSIKAGRQIISYDNQRYMGGLEWAQQGRRHDALLLKFNDVSSKIKLNIGFAFNADDDVPEPQNIQSPTAGYYSVNNYKYMQYAYFNKAFNKLKVSLLAMNLGIQSDTNKVSHKQTLGTHGKSLGSDLTFGYDFYYQMGKSGDRDINAFLAGFNLTYKTTIFPFTLGVEYISGKNGDDASTDIKHFTPDFGTNHAHNGFMDYFFVGPSNGTVGVMDVYFKSKFKLDKSSLAVFAHQFFTGSNQFQSNGKELSKPFGTEFDFVYLLPLRKAVNFQMGYSVLFTSETMKTLRGKNGDINHWAWMMLTVKPELFNSGKLKTK